MGHSGAMEVSARRRILDAAGELFYERGFHAAGVDLIVERAGVAKATLYRHFPTKDDLVVAWLEEADRGFFDWFDRSIAGAAEPDEALAAYLDALQVLATAPSCLGCTFQVAAAEFPGAEHPAHDAAAAHKRRLHDRLRELADDAGYVDVDHLANGLVLLTDGAFAAARMFGSASQAASVASVGRALLAAHRR